MPNDGHQPVAEPSVREGGGEAARMQAAWPREHERRPRQAIDHTIALILAGGRGSRLKELTEHRSKPSLYFGGKYRVVDFALSNCINSGLRRIAVLTQYKSQSLLSHIQRGWSFTCRNEFGEFIELVPAQQQLDDASWYRGTADAVRQNLDLLRARRPSHVMILAGDHVYKMDYRRLLEDHIASGADVTVSCIEVPRVEATQFGIVSVDGASRIVAFVEKPGDPPAVPGKPARSLASMGIYVFDAAFLFRHLMHDAGDPRSTHDFGKDVIPALIGQAQLHAHRFELSCVSQGQPSGPYWRDVGTLDAYWAANIDLTDIEPALDLYDRYWPIFTHHEHHLPPAKFVHDVEGRRGTALNSIVSDGVIVSGASVHRSVLSSKVRINSYGRLDHTVLLPDVEVGRHARLTKAVVDRGCRIPPGFVVGEDVAADRERFARSEGGVTLITRTMLARLGHGAP